MIKKAVIDRFEGKQAILLVDEKPLGVLIEQLPKNSKEGDWLKIEIENGKLNKAEIDKDENEAAKKRIADKMAILRKGKL